MSMCQEPLVVCVRWMWLPGFIKPETIFPLETHAKILAIKIQTVVPCCFSNFQIVSYASKKFTIAMARVLLRNVDINARKYDAGF